MEELFYGGCFRFRSDLYHSNERILLISGILCTVRLIRAESMPKDDGEEDTESCIYKSKCKLYRV